MRLFFSTTTNSLINLCTTTNENLDQLIKLRKIFNLKERGGQSFCNFFTLLQFLEESSVEYPMVFDVFLLVIHEATDPSFHCQYTHRQESWFHITLISFQKHYLWIEFKDNLLDKHFLPVYTLHTIPKKPNEVFVPYSADCLHFYLELPFSLSPTWSTSTLSSCIFLRQVWYLESHKI